MFYNNWKAIENDCKQLENNWKPIEKQLQNNWKQLETIGNNWKQLKTIGKQLENIWPDHFQ